jgi:hypothetical protein
VRARSCQRPTSAFSQSIEHLDWGSGLSEAAHLDPSKPRLLRIRREALQRMLQHAFQYRWCKPPGLE